MRQNWIAAIYNARKIAPLVEHAEIQAEHSGIIDAAGHAAFIRGNNHQMLTVNFQGVHMVDKSFDHLIRRLDVFKPLERDGVLYARVVCVKGDDIINIHHIAQFL